MKIKFKYNSVETQINQEVALYVKEVKWSSDKPEKPPAWPLGSYRS